MSTTELNSFVGNVLNHDNAFFLVAGSFQNEVIALRFFDWQQFFLGTADIDDHWKLSFADLAFELFEVVVLSATDDLFFDLEMDPLGEAFEMDGATGAGADARVEKEVLRVFGLFETDFALGFFLILWRFTIYQCFFGSGIILHNIATGVDPGSVFGAGSHGFAIDTSFADKELDSAELNDLAWFHFIPQILAIFFFEFAYDEVSLLFGFSLAGVGLVSVESLVFI